jgi:uncharacterized protein YjdB
MKTVTVTYKEVSTTFKVFVTTPSINITSNKILDIVEDNKQTIKVTTLPANQELTWSSLNTSVATVENGVVTAVKSGTTAITATYGDQTVTCMVRCS